MNQLREERSKLIWEMTESLFTKGWYSPYGLDYECDSYWLRVEENFVILLEVEFNEGASTFSRLTLTTGIDYQGSDVEYDFKVSDTLTCEAITSTVTLMLSAIH